MMRDYAAKIIKNDCAVDDIFKLTVALDSVDSVEKFDGFNATPGQFIQLKLPSNEFTLRRPLGIAAFEGDLLTVFYRIVGRGTKFLSQTVEGTFVDVIAPLGKGYTVVEGERVLLVGGGLGLAPLIFAARRLKNVDVLIGGKTRAEASMWINEFDSFVSEMFVTTDDGSMGTEGFVTDLLPDVISNENYDAVFVCGPYVMMKNVSELVLQRGIRCEVSLERRMACGLGACLSCSIDTIGGRKKVCKDGPVFDAREVIFNV